MSDERTASQLSPRRRADINLEFLVHDWKMSRAAKSGIAAATQKKIEASYDTEEARKCLSWLRQMTGTDRIAAAEADIDATANGFYTSLHDGYVLCSVLKVLVPDAADWNAKTFDPTPPKIEAMRLMRERERIARFNTMLRDDLGVMDSYTFPVESLHEIGALNLSQVCNSIRALAMEAQSQPGYTGPANYFPRRATENIRDFTEEQLRAGDGVINLQYGTNQCANASGMNFGKQRFIADTKVDK